MTAAIIPPSTHTNIMPKKKRAKAKKTPDSVRPKKENKPRRRRRIRPLSNMELSYFCGQMALILKSGISSIEGVEMMEDDFSTGTDRQIIDTILETVRLTGQFSVGLAATEAFPDNMIHMESSVLLLADNAYY